MIECVNARRISGMDFTAYQGIGDCYNFSFLKGEQFGVAKQFNITDKILSGKLVDDILTGGKVDMAHRLYPAAKKIAAYLKKHFGNILKHLHTQTSFTGTLIYKGFALDVKGRTDYDLPGHLILDLKVTHERNIKGLITHMCYSDQLWLYARLAKVKQAYLLVYSVPLQDAVIEAVTVPDYNEFWAEKILKFGTPV